MYPSSVSETRDTLGIAEKDVYRRQPMKKSIDPKVMFDLKGDAEDSDAFAIQIAKQIARRLVRDPNVTTPRILVIAKALEALEHLPVSTPDFFVEFGVCYEPEGMFSDVHCVYFRITSDTFEIRREGLLDHGHERGLYEDPGWYFDVYGNREVNCQLSDLEEQIDMFLRLGGEIRVSDDFENMFF